MLAKIKTKLLQTRDPELVEDETQDIDVVGEVELPDYDPTQFVAKEGETDA